MHKGDICPCGKRCFTKKGGDKFMKGKKMSRMTSKKTRMYLCDISYMWHISTKRDNF